MRAIGEGVRFAGRAERRLQQLREELTRLRAELDVSEEQLRYLADVADDASTRALVSATPLADLERRAAEDDVARARRQRDETAHRIAELVAEQDRILERMLDAR